jgi:hypothetical protein
MSYNVITNLDQFVSIIGCENDVVQLSCNTGSRLAIYSANFGRTEYESVQCPQPNRVQEESKRESWLIQRLFILFILLGLSSVFGESCYGRSYASLPREKVLFYPGLSKDFWKSLQERVENVPESYSYLR